MKGSVFMSKSYKRQFKRMICELIIIQKHSTIRTAEEFSVPLKTVENWITAYNKDFHCFDDDYISPEQQILKLQKENKELIETNEILKKAAAFFAREK